MTNTTMEDEILLKKQIKTARNMLFIAGSAMTIGAILVVPQVLEGYQISDLVITALQAIIYFLLGSMTKRKPYTAVRIGLGLGIVMILAAVIPHVPVEGHWAARIIALAILLLASGDSKDAQRKMMKR